MDRADLQNNPTNRRNGLSRREVLRAAGAGLVAMAALPQLTGYRGSTVHADELDPLASWNDGAVKQSLLRFVRQVSDEQSPDFVPPAQRIAVLDNDGTLWPEQPFYVQLAFVIERVKALASQHPDWQTTPPFAAVLADDYEALSATGLEGANALLMATHTGMTTEEFARIVRDWFATAKHPHFQQLYTALAYQPMVELLAHLRAHEFKTYIVTGGGIEFVRAISESVYGIPPEQVVGSNIKLQFELRDGVPMLVRLPELEFFDDGDAKPAAIQKFIGQRPIAAFGNSDGDQQMLEWTAAGSGRSLELLVDHTDATREYAYRASSMGQLDKALDEADQRGWLVVDMEADWQRVFAFQ